MEYDVLLLTPVWDSSQMWGKFKDGAGSYLPINIMTIAAYVEKAGFSTKIFDATNLRLTKSFLSDYFQNNSFKVIGISSYTASICSAYRTATLAKKLLPNVKIMLGGIHGTLLPEQSLRECPALDSVCIGEGEATFLEYIKHCINGEPTELAKIEGIAYRDPSTQTAVRTNPRAANRNLAWLPMPAYHLVSMERYLMPPANYHKKPAYATYVSRGCPFTCSFCNSRDIFGPGGAGYRPIDHVIAEIRLLQNRYGMQDVFFYDGTFTTNKKWVQEFCIRLIKEKIHLEWSCNTRCDTVDWETARLMKRAGCWKVLIGVESANQKSLDLLNKRETVDTIENGIKYFKKAGIQITASYILGLPGETEEDVMKTIRFSRKLATEAAMYFIPVPMPQTKLMDDCRTDGGLVGNADDWNDYSTFNIEKPLYVNPRIGHKRLAELYDYAYKTYYSNPRVILANLSKVRSMTEIKRLLNGFLVISNFFKGHREKPN